MEHQKAGSQYITGCASMGGLGVRRDIPTKLNLANLNAWMWSCSYKIIVNNFNSYIYMVNLINFKSANSKSLKPGFLFLKRPPKLNIKSWKMWNTEMKIYPGSDTKYTKLIMYCMKNVIYFTFSTHPLELLLLLHFLLHPVHPVINTTDSSHHTFYTSSGLPPHHTLFTVR